MTKFIAKITNATLDFGSEYNEFRYRDFLKENEGMLVEIKPRSNPVSDEMRGYMFGAVIPFLRQIDPTAWTELSDDQVYEVLKKNFNYFEAFNPLTKRVERYGQSALNKSCKNKKAMEFTMRIADWVMENYGQNLPDPEDYKRWINSAPILREKV